MKRVVITGLGCISPLGIGVNSLMSGLAENRNAVQKMDGWEIYQNLRSLVGAPAPLENEKEIPRKQRRSMGRMSIFAAQAAKQAQLDSGLDAEISLVPPWAVREASTKPLKSCFPTAT